MARPPLATLVAARTALPLADTAAGSTVDAVPAPARTALLTAGLGHKR